MSAPVTSSDSTCVVIQDRSRLFRDSLSLVLGSTAPIRVRETVADERALRAACAGERVDAVLLEVEGVPWDVTDLVSAVRSVCEPVVVGTFRSDHGHQQPIPGVELVPRTAAGRVFAAALRGQAGEVAIDGAVRQPDTLTRREVQVLALISGGSTASQIADRLGISVKTVENRKQALFAKLGVQNQSHAVAVAMRTGLLGSAPVDPGAG
jgi:DNA-binding NarL/FixJ family response regulator